MAECLLAPVAFSLVCMHCYFSVLWLLEAVQRLRATVGEADIGEQVLSVI